MHKKEINFNLEKYLNNCSNPILVIGSGFKEFKIKNLINKFLMILKFQFVILGRITFYA